MLWPYKLIIVKENKNNRKSYYKKNKLPHQNIKKKIGKEIKKSKEKKINKKKICF